VPLTNTQIQNCKPQGKTVKLFDERGLYLEVTPTGNRWWRFKYQFGGKEKRISLGVFPDVGLKDARDRRDEARKQVAAGIDPSELRKKAKIATVEKVENTVEVIAREWFAKFSPTWNAVYAERIIHRLETDAFPWLGERPIKDVKPVELLSVLRRIESRGALETAHRILQYCGKVFRYAVATGRAERDISSDLRGALPPTKEKHYASIVEPKAVGTSRETKCVSAVLGLTQSDTDVLLTDGYAAYNAYANKTGMTHARCWVHVRRDFFEAEASDPAGVHQALKQIGALYDIEEDIRKNKLGRENKRLHRLTHSKPRVIPMGRKNWNFCWTELGAEHIGIAQSLIVTCRPWRPPKIPHPWPPQMTPLADVN